jgi:hypothetical protein
MYTEPDSLEVGMRRCGIRELAFASLAVASLAIILSGGGTRVEAQQPVKVFLSAVDVFGQPVTDLKASDVSLILDGTDCPGIKVDPINWPMKLTVLIDNGDVMVNALSSLREGLRTFFGQIPEDVETSLLTYSPQPVFVVRPTTDRQQLIGGIDRVFANAGKGARFVDAVSEAVARIDKEKGDFFYTLMFLVTDGPEGSMGNLEGMINEVVQRIARRPVMVHVLLLSAGPRVLVGQVAGTKQVLVSDALTKQTGGRFESIVVGARLPALLREYADQIARSHLLQSHQHRITCDKSPSKTPKISVSMFNPDVAHVVLSMNGNVP